MPASTQPAPRPWLAHEQLYVGIDIGKFSHVAGLVSTTLLRQHRRFEACPAYTFAQSREGFDRLVTWLSGYTLLAQVVVLLESTGHYHRALEQYLLDCGVTVYMTHVQKRPSHMLKSDKRDALALGNMLYNQVEKQTQQADPRNQARRVAHPSDAARELRSLTRHRYELAREIVRRRNKLTSICDELFPEMTQICKNPNGMTALSIREAFPTAGALGGAELSQVLACRKGSRPGKAGLARLITLARTSIGTSDQARINGLIVEQEQLICELRLLQRHEEQLAERVTTIVEACREGQILMSVPVIGPLCAAAMIAVMGTVDNFDSAAQLKSYLGWAPSRTQTGTTKNATSLSHSGNRGTRHLIYLAVLTAVRTDCEWKKLYDRLVPIKCAYDESKGKYKGKQKVIGRVAGQMIALCYMLLKKDAALLLSIPAGAEPPPPALYDASIHKTHREGQYRPRPAGVSKQAVITPIRQVT